MSEPHRKSCSRFGYHTVLLLLAGCVAACTALPDSSTGDAQPAAEALETFADVSSGPAPRTLRFTNQCSFDVWLESVGSNASVLPCSPSESSAQANCPADFICYAKDVNTTYCVPGTTSAKTFPVTSPSQITLNATTCESKAAVTDTTSAQWGQCTCTNDSDCPTNQVCQQTGAIHQCYWGYALADEGKVAASGGEATLEIDISSTASDAIIASGKFFAKAACDVNGNCLSDNTKGAPATLIEYTFQNDNDWYDVSYINGINLPAVMYPDLSTSLDFEKDDPYRCMAAGGDQATINTILAYQKANSIQGNDALEPFACTNDYATIFADSLAGFNFVYASDSMSCTTAQDCVGSAAGPTCGLSLATVQDTLTQLTCGDRLGYWTYAQFCAANSSYVNADLGIDCRDEKTLAYALCRNQASVSDQGPGRSCFNANTTAPDSTCCGYARWSSGGISQPMGKGDAAVSGVDTSYWAKNILPAVRRIKEGCYLAYAYQYDDPFSTFTCATTGGTVNQTSYNITLCPGSDDAGIDPPTPPSCTAEVPAGYDSTSFFVAFSKGFSLTVDSCDASGSCTTPLVPTVKPTDSTFFAIFEAGSSAQYQITAKNESTGQEQPCRFAIPQSGCIGRVSTSAVCKRWTVSTTGGWTGRQIAVPSF